MADDDVMPRKKIKIGTLDRYAIYVEVELRSRGNGLELSICGIEQYRPHCDYSSCGQIIDTVARVRKFAPGWDRAKLAQLIRIWRRWHHNGMRAGCEHQRALGWTYAQHPSEPCPECGYRLGAAWLYEALPDDVITFVRGV